MARTNHLYVFGKIKETHDAPAKEYGCLCYCGAVDRKSLEEFADRKAADGFDCFFHDGETAGRDSFPVNPAPALAAAMERSGWTKPYLPTENDREFARRAGYDC